LTKLWLGEYQIAPEKTIIYKSLKSLDFFFCAFKGISYTCLFQMS